MADEPEDLRTLKEKILFYMTAFFVLLGTFSLFAFLFLVPFVIDPAFTTIFMQFDTTPAFCLTVETENYKGASNCSWTSCREGCTKEVYECTQIRVNYKVAGQNKDSNDTTIKTADELMALEKSLEHTRYERAIRDYEYAENALQDKDEEKSSNGLEFMEYPDVPELNGLIGGNDSEWFFTGARLFPNVKGCGYPPMLNCTIWSKKYKEVGTNFSCYYSKVDPGLVISDLDMWQNTLNLVYAMAIPIPSFIISVIYLTFAYFKIYNEDEEFAPLDKNAEEIAGEDPDANEVVGSGNTSRIIPNGTTPTSGPMTPNSDLASFGHKLKVKMADEMSRESLDGGLMSNSGSLHRFVGNFFFFKEIT